MLKLNYGINRRVGRKIEHANGKLCIKGQLTDGTCHAKVLAAVRQRHPGWNLTGYAVRKPKIPTHVFMVMTRFVPLIDKRIKRTTVRANRKRMPEGGDYIDLRRWKGEPYRSKQVRVLLCQIQSVRRFCITSNGTFCIDGSKLSAIGRELCARTDGFANGAEMVAFFQATHGLPFKGFITEWL